jgi:hypothetical protein
MHKQAFKRKWHINLWSYSWDVLISNVSLLTVARINAHSELLRCVLFLTCRREKFTVVCPKKLSKRTWSILGKKEPFLVGGLRRMQCIPTRSSPMQVNCPVLHDAGLTPPFAILEPTTLITPS